MPTLYVLATPIGNLEDITLRALRVLKEVDCILCEDTRRTKKLLFHFQISKLLLSYHQHSRLKRIKEIASMLKSGKNLALVSDAGTPGISDPGNELLNILLREDIEDFKTIPIPGPSAITSALSICGFNVSKFIFLGFPPAKKKRKKFFEEIQKARYPVLIFESPWRILKTLKELEGVSGKEREIVVSRELTKKFETIYRGGIEKIIKELEKQEIKGEFAVVIGQINNRSRPLLFNPGTSPPPNEYF